MGRKGKGRACCEGMAYGGPRYCDCNKSGCIIPFVVIFSGMTGAMVWLGKLIVTCAGA